MIMYGFSSLLAMIKILREIIVTDKPETHFKLENHFNNESEIKALIFI